MATVISELFDESGMSVQAFADKAGLKYGTAYDIAKGVSKVENIGAGAFVRIAHVFGKTADELLSDIPNDENSQTLSNEEWALISNYRRCSSGVQDAIRNLSISFAGVPDEAELAYRAMVNEQEREYYNKMISNEYEADESDAE